jgi:hypothetical protein
VYAVLKLINGIGLEYKNSELLYQCCSGKILIGGMLKI